MLTGLPPRHRDQVRQQPGGLRQRQPDRVTSVDQTSTADARIMMRGSDVECQSSQLRCAADHVGGAAQHGAGHRCDPRAGHSRPECGDIPVGDGIGGRTVRHTDGVHVVVVAGVDRVGAARQHRAAVEIEHEASGAVGRRHPQRGETGRGAAGPDGILLQCNDFRAGGQRVADDGKAVKGQAPVEQIGHHPLRHERGLADRHIADQRGMGEPSPGHRSGELRVEGKPHPVAEDRLMSRCRTGRQRHRRCTVEHSTDVQIIEERAAGHLAVQIHSPHAGT